MKSELEDKIIKYAETLNKYEKGNYKLDDNEYNLFIEMEKLKQTDEKYSTEIAKVYKMTRKERENFIEQKKEQQQEENIVRTTTEEIAQTFNVSEKDIDEETLKDGKTVYVIYDQKTNKNIILEDGANNKSLTKELEEIKEENSNNYEDTDYEEILDEKMKNENIELTLVPINKLDEYASYISNLSKEKTRELDCIIKYAKDLKIDYINLENMIGIDNNGKIFEAYYDKEANEYKIAGTNQDVKENAEKEEKDGLREKLQRDSINEMLDEEEISEELSEELTEEKSTAKTLTMNYNKPTNNIDTDY